MPLDGSVRRWALCHTCGEEKSHFAIGRLSAIVADILPRMDPDPRVLYWCPGCNTVSLRPEEENANA